MNTTLASFEVESPAPQPRPTDGLQRLEVVAGKLRDQCAGNALYGMHEFRLEPSDEGTVLDQEHTDDREFAEVVLDSAGATDPGAVDAVVGLVVTDADRYNNYLATNVGTPAGNFHADYRPVFAEGRVLFYPPRAGRLAIALFGPGITGFAGRLRLSSGSVTHYSCYDPTRKSSQYFKEMKSKKRLVVGEQGLVLRGPLDPRKLAEDNRTRQHETEQWLYWHPRFIHRGTPVQRPGRVQIFVDFKPGRDPFLQSN